jgi:hypothetical protein
VQGVSDAPLSEAAASSCARDNRMTRAEATREVYRTLRAHPARSPAAETLGLQCTDRYKASRAGRCSGQRSANACKARRFVR